MNLSKYKSASDVQHTIPIPSGFRMLRDNEIINSETLFWDHLHGAFCAECPFIRGAKYQIGVEYRASIGIPAITPNGIPKQSQDISIVRSDKESIKVLRECMELQTKKSNDYQHPNSRIRQADYYPSGLKTILDIMHAKMLRLYSVIEAMENDPSYTPNFESIEDSGKDLCNYSSFMVAYCRQGIDGQLSDRDFLNRKIPV